MSSRAITPATGEPIKEFPRQSDQEVFAVLERVNKRSHEDWKLRSVAEREGIVGRAAETLREKRDEYA